MRRGPGAMWWLLIIIIAVPAVTSSLLRHAMPPRSERRQGGIAVRVRMPDGSVRSMGLETYVSGVVTAEMPSGFHLQALAAQAVAARTYALHRLTVDPDATIDANPERNQAWGRPASLFARLKVARAVRLSRGIVVTYAGQAIDAVYHSTSGPTTASAEEVWGTPVPYLLSKPCPYCANAPKAESTVTVTASRARALLGLGSSTGSVPLAPSIALSVSGRVSALRLAGKVLSGREARAMFGLNSTRFTVSETPVGGLAFAVIGYGHGVGLCQYGANGMAAAGAGFRDILTFYYPGTRVEALSVSSALRPPNTVAGRRWRS